MKKIKIRIYPDGIIQAETEGIKGKKCSEYKNIIKNITNARIVEEEYTSEYYEDYEEIENEEMEKLGVDLSGN